MHLSVKDAAGEIADVLADVDWIVVDQGRTSEDTWTLKATHRVGHVKVLVTLRELADKGGEDE